MNFPFSDFTQTWHKLNLDQKLRDRDRLQTASERPDFWSDQKSAQDKMAQLARLNSELEPWLALKSTLSDFSERVGKFLLLFS